MPRPHYIWPLHVQVKASLTLVEESGVLHVTLSRATEVPEGCGTRVLWAEVMVGKLVLSKLVLNGVYR